MAKMKRRKPRSAAARTKVARRRASSAKTAARTLSARSRARKVIKRTKRSSSAAVGAAAKRVVVSAGRTARAFANVGARHVERTGRKLLARGTRAAASGVRKGARVAGDFTASTLQQIAERVDQPK